MQDLPQDVWELVATYLSQEELVALVAINRVFLNLVLDTRFGEVEWIQPNSRMVKSLIRLIDPFVAKRVKRLCIRDSLMQDLLQKTNHFEDPGIVPVVHGMMGRLYGFMSKTPTSPAPEISLEGIEDRPRDIVRLIAQAITKMSNLRIFALECRDLSRYKDTERILQACRSVYNPYLHKLVLHGTLSELSSMIAGVTLVDLEDLDLTFECDSFASPGGLVGARLASAINTFAPNLSSLKILSYAYDDHSQFFKSLGLFPELRHLSIRVRFDKHHFPDTSGLNEVLRRHRLTLHHLEILPEHWNGEDESQTSAWAIFLEQCLLDLDQWPTSLQTLSIPAFDLPTTMSLVRPVANTLTSLRLAHKYLTYLEVADVIDLFHRRPTELKHLSLDVTLTTPNLLGLLARKLPGLVSLTLVIEDATSTMQSILRTDPNGSDNIAWKLYDLSIFNKKFRDDSIFIGAPMSFEFEEGLMAQFSYLLPSVRSFKGRGHMDMIRIC
ncbi:hypothetical protein DXG01_002671 [Tephrocybe rancida]|nr:hypothetical protein DXG01_002671 [Tephrocybe rancida]